MPLLSHKMRLTHSAILFLLCISLLSSLFFLFSILRPPFFFFLDLFPLG